MSTVLFLIRQYWIALRGQRALALLSLLLFTASYSVWVIEPFVFAKIINTIQHTPNAEIMGKIIPLILLLVSFTFIFNILFRPACYLSVKLAYYAKSKYIERAYRKLTSLSLKWHSEHHSGESINRVNKASDSISELVSEQWNYFEIMQPMFGSLIGLFIIEPRIAIAAMCVMGMIFFLTSFVDRRIMAQTEKINNMQNSIMAILFDFISNIRSIIILRLGGLTTRSLNAKVEEARRPTEYTWGVLGEIKWTIISLSFIFLHVGVMFYFIYLGLKSGESIDIGKMTAVYMFTGQIGSSFFNLAHTYQRFMRYKAGIENASVIDGAKEFVPHKTGEIKWKRIDVCDMRFSYTNGKRDILGGEDKALERRKIFGGICLSFRRGDKIALMGESGSGKSTLMFLLRGLAETARAKVKIDGKIAPKGLGSLAPITTLMLQDPEVFENTIRYNITMGLDYSDEKIANALRLSRFDVVLAKLPRGLDTNVCEKGVNLSGGERQRLALTRNILAAYNSDIILMDEATSSVDAENERMIFDGILREFKDKTIIAIVHKYNVANKFPKILRIENGEMITKKGE